MDAAVKLELEKDEKFISNVNGVNMVDKKDDFKTFCID